MTHIIMNIFATNKGNPLISSLIKYPKLYAPINKQVIICKTKNSLDNALITNMDSIDPETKKRLLPLLKNKDGDK